MATKMKYTIIKSSGAVDEEEQARRDHNARHIKESFALAKGEPITGDGKSGISGRRSSASFSNVVFGGVTKMVGDGVREFMPGDLDIDRYEPDEVLGIDDLAAENEDARMGATLASWAGKGTIEQPRPAWARDSFLEPSGMYGQAPIQAYVNREGDADAPTSLNFMDRGMIEGLAAPADFRAPKPGDKRMGDGYVLKSSGFWANLLGPQPQDGRDLRVPSLETIERAARYASDEEYDAYVKSIAKFEKSDTTPAFSQAHQRRDAWLYAGR